jgi:hypothetical protein
MSPASIGESGTVGLGPGYAVQHKQLSMVNTSHIIGVGMM